MLRKSHNSAKLAGVEGGGEARLGALDSRTPLLSRDEALLYLTALGICLIGTWGIWFALDSPAVGIVVLCGVIAGFAASLWLRGSSEPFLATLLSLAGFLALLLVLRLVGIDLFTWVIFNRLVFSEPTLAAAGVMGIVLIITSFLLISREALTFAIVPVLTIFGLIGTLLDPRVMLGFLLFLFISIFLLGYAHILTLQEELGSRLSLLQAQRMPRNHLLISGGFFLTVLLIAFGLSLLLMAGFSREGFQRLLDALSRLQQITAPTPGLDTRLGQSGIAYAGADYRVGVGPISLGHNPVMYVKTNSPELWRQRVYDLYTGDQWKVSGAPSGVPINLQEGKISLPELVAESLDSRLVKQTFRLALPFREGIPAAAQPVEVDFGTSRGAPTSIEIDRFGCLVRAGHILPPGYSYQVISSIPRPARSESKITLEENEREPYLQFPWGARRVRGLVAEIIPRNISPEAKIAGLLAHLHSGDYRYTLRAKAVPSGEDAADFFLFNSREGYCDLFATAFAVMCRAAGIPSRFAVGYAEGTPNPSTGEYLVRESDGHAWVEIFLEGAGWVSVDPTPPGRAAEARKEATVTPPWWRKYLRRFRTSLALLFLCTIVFAGAAKSLWLDPWRARRRWEKRLWSTMKGRIAVFYARMCRLFAKKGLLRQPWQTPLEYLALLSANTAKTGAALKPARELTRIFLSSRYGGDSTGPETVTAAQGALSRLKRNLPRRQWISRLHKKRK